MDILGTSTLYHDTLSTTDIVKYHDKLFVLTRDTYSLFEYDILSGKTRWCGSVRKQTDQVFICMAVCEDKIYIAPYEADVIPIYDIATGEFEYIFLKQSKGKRKNKYYHLCLSYQYKVFFLGGLYSTMLSIDVQNNTVNEVTDWIDEFRKVMGKETAVRTQADKCIVGDCFWVALEGNNILMQYNMMRGSYQFWHVGKESIQYSTINYDGEFFWLSGNKNLIVRWQKETGSVKKITLFPDGFETGEGGQDDLFYCCYPWKGQLYFAPCISNMLIRFDTKMEKMNCVLKIHNPNLFTCELTEINERELYIEIMDRRGFSRFSRYSYVINEEDEYYNYSIKADREKEIRYEMDNRFVIENNSKCLDFFLAKEKVKGNSCEVSDCIGKEIYKMISER